MFQINLSKCVITTTALVLMFLTIPVQAQLSTAKMDVLRLQFNNATFKKTAITKLDIKASNVNFASGSIKNISVLCTGIKQKDIFIDKMNFTFNNAQFSSEKLLTNQELMLKNPVTASGSITITENNINTMLNNTKTQKKLANLAKIKIKQLGLKINGGLVSFIKPKAHILPNNTLRIEMTAALAGMIGFPVILQSQITLQNNKIVLTNPKIITSGMDLPDEISGLLNQKLNEIIDVNEKFKEDADIRFTSVNVIPNSSINITANALIKKLNFKKKNVK
ncbi:MAG: LmeA family phospholipid-binding protein [Vampirovibrionia bacterium]